MSFFSVVLLFFLFFSLFCFFVYLRSIRCILSNTGLDYCFMPARMNGGLFM